MGYKAIIRSNALSSVITLIPPFYFPKYSLTLLLHLGPATGLGLLIPNDVSIGLGQVG